MENPLTIDIGSEGGVLGSMLMDRKMIPGVREVIQDRFYFTKIEHQILFAVLCDLHENTDPNIEWDLVLVRDVLRQEGTLSAIGGVECLVRLCESVPTVANAVHYAACVKAAYRRRQIAQFGTSLLKMATEPNEISEVINTAISDLNELSAETEDRTKTDGSQAVKSLIEDSIHKRRIIIQMPWRIVNGLTMALQPATVTLLCGTPGASKSFAALEIMQSALNVGHRAAYYALEDSAAFHLSRMLAQKTGLSGLTSPQWIYENPIIATAAHDENKDWLVEMGRYIEASGDRQATYGNIVSWSMRMARSGCKLLIIDPVTAIQHTARQVWAEDNEFLQRIKHISTNYGCAILLVTHPAKCEGKPSMEMLAGGACFSRFSQTILWLEYHESKTSSIRFDCGTSEETHNRTLHILKARLSKGQGKRVAMTFTDGLLLKEHGAIVKTKRQKDLYED